MSQVSQVYKDYEHQPYISDKRNLLDWEQYPEKYPYSKVEKKQMMLLEEGLFPGDIIMLWRIGFNNFTNESIFPDYFEYRYGVDANESIERLIQKGYVIKGTAADSLDVVSGATIKRILKEQGLKVSGKKLELVQRLLNEVPSVVLEASLSTRVYIAMDEGRSLLKKYDDIIQRHGPKQL